MLEITNLGVRYGHHLALEGVSVKVDKGEICVILGANGAGKSSLLKAIAGMVKTEPGSTVVMNGRTISGMKAHRIVEEGIALVPEGRGIFGDLTVAENLQLGAFAKRARGEQDATLKRIYELFPRLAERKRQVARTMSGGEQQMVAIGRALMSKPDILMLDEPSLGLSPLLTKELFRSLQAIAQTGVGILLVEQNAKQSLKIAGRGYLIENGLITGENTAAALASDPAVVNAYLGGGTQTDKKARIAGLALPAGFALPSGLAAMGRFMGALAGRAGVIQSAFVRFLRGHSAVPSAFVGRYDPASDGKAWERLSFDAPARDRETITMVSSDARSVAQNAGALAAAASERLSRHVRSGRLGMTAPSAFSTRPAATPQPPETGRPQVATQTAPAREPRTAERAPSFDASSLAERAAQRLAEHMKRQRGMRAEPVRAAARNEAPAAPAPSQRAGAAFDAATLAAAAAERLAAHMRRQRAASAPAAVKAPPQAEPAAPKRQAEAPSPLLGHNSAGFDLEDEENQAPDLVRPSGSSGPLDFADLVTRAAARQAEHTAERRKSLTAFRFTPAAGKH